MNQDKIIDIEDLTPDAHNFNQGTDEGRQLMQRSLSELGAGRSILVDRNGNVIAGNKTQEAAIKAGIRRVRVIETDGTELVAVKRTDIDIDSAKGRELALVDNLATQVNLAWDEAELEAMDVEGFDPGQWGWEPPEIQGEPTDETEEEAAEPAEPAEEATVEPKLKPAKGDVVNFDVILGGDAKTAVMYSENNSVYFETLEFTENSHVTGTVVEDDVHWGVVFVDEAGQPVDYLVMGNLEEAGETADAE